MSKRSEIESISETGSHPTTRNSKVESLDIGSQIENNTRKPPKKSPYKPKANSSIPVINKDTTSTETYEYGTTFSFSNKKQIFSKREIKKTSSAKHPFKTLNIKSHKHSRIIQTAERLLEFRKQADLKLLKEKEEKLAEELKECAFKPKTNTPVERRRRTSEEFYREELKKSEQAKEKIEKLRSSIPEPETPSFMPSLCQNSIAILANTRSPTTSAFLKLHELYRHKSNKNKDLYCVDQSELEKEKKKRFTPTINRKSIALAKKPSFQISQPFSQESYNTFTPSKRSISILIEKFLKELEEEVKNLKIESKLNYIKFVELFCNMKFIDKGKSKKLDVNLLLGLWESLKGESDQVDLQDIKAVFMGIMGYFELWMKSSTLSFTSETTKIFHEKYKRLFENRRHLIENESSKELTEKKTVNKTCKKRNLAKEKITEESLTSSRDEKFFREYRRNSLAFEENPRAYTISAEDVIKKQDELGNVNSIDTKQSSLMKEMIVKLIQTPFNGNFNRNQGRYSVRASICCSPINITMQTPSENSLSAIESSIMDTQKDLPEETLSLSILKFPSKEMEDSPMRKLDLN